MGPRIARSPLDVAQQLMEAAVGIGNEANWPATFAPTAAQVLAARDAILNKGAEVANAEGALKVLRREHADATSHGRGILGTIDSATDLLYGPDGPAKANFGLAPKKTTQTASGPPERVVISAIGDGTHPASLFVDWDSVDGAVFEVQWFSDAPLTQMVGSATVTPSEIEITGLTRGSQYWVRVRAVRAGQVGPWSDQATRVANI